MGDKTGIAWCDHTFNPWIGCKKVSPGCVNCYAERENKRFGWLDTEWGDGYRRTSASNWKKPLEWGKQAELDGVTRRVFCASLADVFDADVPDKWREDLWELINSASQYKRLEWLLLTKRPQNIADLKPRGMSWKNVRLGITTETQRMLDERLPILTDAWSGKNFLSVEPMVGPVDLSAYIGKVRIDWVICGCESGPNARPMQTAWVRDLRNQCVQAGIPFLLKQMVIDGRLVATPLLDGDRWVEFPESDPKVRTGVL